ncbi:MULTISPECIES: NUDIX domain-containing protein [Ramlibacter]|uniref:NUDIX hydrolase n=1 Tax=Ramlibacter TaxID=174951 RepID=UPI0025805D96|nr:MULTISPECIES: NUDIX domain-containing protein [Ramlibacter]
MSDWRARVRAAADQPPARPRVPLWWAQHRIGSVEPGLLEPLGLAPEVLRPGRDGWVLGGDCSASLHLLAHALREAGLSHAWRDEQLAVAGEAGEIVGSVERGVVRPLGIPTLAVHLMARAPDGRHWVQQRSLTKPNDPGLWDTLMGGMVPASDSVAQALARETWEEAGLQLTQLHALHHGGRFLMRRPTGAGAAGYVVEWVEWYGCVLPDGVVPRNMDGEVQDFRCLPPDELERMLDAGAFTVEAACVLAAAGV